MKRMHRVPLRCELALISLLAALIPALATAAELPPPSAQVQTATTGLAASTSVAASSNYCIACHTADDARLDTVTAWAGTIEREATDPCPAARIVHEELYYTERMLVAMDRAGVGVSPLASVETRVAAARQSYSKLLDAPVQSLDAFATEAQTLRYRLNKSYVQVNQQHDAVKQRNILIVAALVSLILLVALGWGFRHTLRFAAGRGRMRVRGGAVVAVVGVLICFSLPIFRVFQQEVASSTEEELTRQTVLDTANRVATTADRELARAWGLARVAGAWAKADPQAAEAPLQDALSAAENAQINTFALWGEAQAAQEAAVGVLNASQTAGLIANRLDASRSRAWGLRMVAAEWAAIDPARAEAILAEAAQIAQDAPGIYHDLDLRAIAATWARLNPTQAAAVAGQVRDPALRAWAFREVAEVTGDRAYYDQAVTAARQVASAVERSRCLRQIAASSGQPGLFDEALAALAGVQGAARAYALSDLAAAANDPAIADQIDAAYPAARAAALYRAGQFNAAWTAAADITDPLERARGQAAIAAAWGNTDAAQKITDPPLRDRALRDVAIAKKDAGLAGGIESPYYRVQALTALGQLQAAAALAGDLSDTFPLRGLATALANTDPQAALALVDQMNPEADKAEALTAVVAATGDPAVFERALGMALAARVSGDNLAPVEAALALVRSASDAGQKTKAFTQAYETAQRITVKYK